MESLIQLLINKYDCGSEEAQLSFYHERALMECNLLKETYSNFFNFVDEIYFISGEFTAILNDTLKVQIIGNRLRRDLKYREICISEPSEEHATYNVNNFPPIFLKFYLSSCYPIDSNFLFTLDCPWLPAPLLELLTVKLTAELSDFPNEMALKHSCEFLKTKALQTVFESDAGGILSFNVLSNCLGSSNIPTQQLTELLVCYEEEQRDNEFKSNVYECPICITPLPGSDCVRLRACGHVSCRECISNHFSVQVHESAHGGTPTCPECNEVVRQQEIRDVVSEEIYTDYERRLLNKTLSEMPDVVACPNNECPNEHVSLDEDLSQGLCPQCRFHFCARCNAAFHEDTACKQGPLDKLSPAEADELLNRYKSAGENGKRDLALQYGLMNLNKLADNRANTLFIEKECKLCPNCNSPIQKNEGCNRMNCQKCLKNFCWVCLKVLDDKQPYNHFQRKCALFPGM